MSRGATYFGLLAALRQEELLYEARQRTRPTQTLRRRRRRSLTAALMRRLRRRTR